MNAHDDRSGLKAVYAQPNIDGRQPNGSFPSYAAGSTIWVPQYSGMATDQRVVMSARTISGGSLREILRFDVTKVEPHGQFISGEIFIAMKNIATGWNFYYTVLRGDVRLEFSHDLLVNFGNPL